jgi:hypothetical protein
MGGLETGGLALVGVAGSLHFLTPLELQLTRHSNPTLSWGAGFNVWMNPLKHSWIRSNSWRSPLQRLCRSIWSAVPQT